MQLHQEASRPGLFTVASGSSTTEEGCTDTKAYWKTSRSRMNLFAVSLMHSFCLLTTIEQIPTPN